MLKGVKPCSEETNFQTVVACSRKKRSRSFSAIPKHGLPIFAMVACTITIISSTSLPTASAVVISDDERRAGFVKHNYSWPIPFMVPDTPGWDRLMRRRIRQVEASDGQSKQDKYDMWVVALESALVVPNFTEYGWAVTKAPEHLTREMQSTLRHQFESQYPEGHDPAIVGDYPTTLVDMPELIDRALHQILPYAEAWSGVPLKIQRGYGMRIYPNTSRLLMHLDKITTHVISCIFHIDHSVDNIPWPLVIEDFDGITQKVVLQPGDMLFYESAKCLHGRPIPLEGNWYTSLFLHYSPIVWPFEEQDWMVQYAIPDHWEADAPEMHVDGSTFPKLQNVDSALVELGCPNLWCAATEKTSLWEGETKKGVFMSSHESKRFFKTGDWDGNEEL